MYKIRDWLLIGRFIETVNLPLLEEHHIGAMLQLASPIPYQRITTLYLPIEDGVALNLDHLINGVQFIREQKAQDKIVLVACGAGISRSSTFAIAALKEEENLSLKDALHEVKKHHRYAAPHPELWKTVHQHYEGFTPSLPEIWEFLDSKD